MRRLLPLIGTTALMSFVGMGVLELRTEMRTTLLPLPDVEETNRVDSPPAMDVVASPEAIDPSAALDRPIFAPGRRPLAPLQPEIDPTPAVELVPVPREEPEAVPMVPSPSPPIDRLAGLRLLGVMTGAGPDRALVSLPNTGAEWVRIDAEIRGWRVAGIWPDRIEVRRGSRRRIAELGDEGSGGAGE